MASLLAVAAPSSAGMTRSIALRLDRGKSVAESIRVPSDRPRASDMQAPPVRTATPALLLWGFVFTVLCVTASRNPQASDGRQMCHAASSLLQRGTFAIDPTRSDVVRGPDGNYYTKYPLLTVLQCVPALGLQTAARKLASADAMFEAWALGLVPHVLSATLALGIMQLALALGASVSAAVWLALLSVFTTPLWVAGRSLYSENLQAVLVIWITLMTVRARDARNWAAFIWVGVLCGLAINTKVVLAVMPLVLIVDQCHERVGRARLVRLLAGALPGIALGVLAFFAYNKLRFGGLLTQGYTAERDGALGFSVALPAGVHGLLFGSGKSVFLYAPILLGSVLAVPAWFRTRRRELWLIAIPALTTLGVSACWWAWAGDWAWGPRFLSSVVPLACLPLMRALMRPRKRTRLAILTLAALGLYVQVLGISIDAGSFLKTTWPMTRAIAGKQFGSVTLRDGILPVHFVPELNPIVGHQWLLLRYLRPSPWTEQSYYPWRGLGFQSWRPDVDPTPAHLDFWIDSGSSRTALLLEGVLAALALALGALLVKQLSSTSRACCARARGTADRDVTAV